MFWIRFKFGSFPTCVGLFSIPLVFESVALGFGFDSVSGRFHSACVRPLVGLGSVWLLVDLNPVRFDFDFRQVGFRFGCVWFGFVVDSVRSWSGSVRGGPL